MYFGNQSLLVKKQSAIFWCGSATAHLHPAAECAGQNTFAAGLCKHPVTRKNSSFVVSANKYSRDSTPSELHASFVASNPCTSAADMTTLATAQLPSDDEVPNVCYSVHLKQAFSIERTQPKRCWQCMRTAELQTWPSSRNRLQLMHQMVCESRKTTTTIPPLCVRTLPPPLRMMPRRRRGASASMVIGTGINA